jgi:hypothetical protein
MSYQPIADASTYTGQRNIYTQETNIHALSWIRTSNFSNQAAADLRLKPHGHRDQPHMVVTALYNFKIKHAEELIISTD